MAPRGLVFALLVGASASACRSSSRTQHPTSLAKSMALPAERIVQLPLAKLAPDPQRPAQDELLALHLTYDLLDRARFAGDAKARDRLWEILGPSPSRRGVEAFRLAASNILERAWALEDRVQSKTSSSLSAQQQDSLHELIRLLSLDVSSTGDGEQLQDLALALSAALPSAGPDTSDNLWWRRYDFDRALMAEILAAPPQERAQLARWGELLLQEDAEQAPEHASTLDRWLAPWHTARKVLGQDPRWSGTIQARATQDKTDYDRIAQVLAVPRLGDWDLPTLDPQDLDPDPLTGLVRIQDGQLQIDGRNFDQAPGQARAGRIADHMALVGRDELTLAADRTTPAPQLHALLQDLSAAGVPSLLMAGYPQSSEPAPKGYHTPLFGVWTTLLAEDKAQVDEHALFVAAFAQGYRIGWDGALVPKTFSSLTQLEPLLARYRYAYPIQDRVQVAMASDLSYEQRLSLLVTLTRALGPKLRIEQWAQSSSKLPPNADHLQDELKTRSRWRWPRGQSLPSPEIEVLGGAQPDETVHAKLFAFAQRLYLCLPELERTKYSKPSIELELNFSEGSLASWQWQGSAKTRVAAVATQRFDGCLQHFASAVRLPGWRAGLRVKVRLKRPSASR